MITCPNCGTENRLGSIFCRSCGTKLAIDDVNVQNFEERSGTVPKDKQDKKKKKKKVVGHLIRLVIILLIALGVFLIFVKPEKPDDIKTTSEAYESFKTKMKDLTKAGDDKNGADASFTEEEINSFITQMVIDLDKEGSVALSQVFVDILEDDKVRIYFDIDLFNLRIVATCEGTVSGSDKGLVFKPSGFFSSKLGKLPYPMPLFKRMTTQLLNDDVIQDFIALIDSAEIKDGKVEVKVGE